MKLAKIFWIFTHCEGILTDLDVKTPTCVDQFVDIIVKPLEIICDSDLKLLDFQNLKTTEMRF